MRFALAWARTFAPSESEGWTNPCIERESRALQRVLDVQRLGHNWVRPQHGLAKNTTPVMALGYCDRPITMRELLTQRSFASLMH